MLVSVIIPARAGEEVLWGLLPQLPPHRDVQVIVSLADAQDPALLALRTSRRDVMWAAAAGGRGPQLNAGAARATATWLWFVHADSVLPEGWLDAFRGLDPSGVVGGSFSFRLDSAAWQARVLERLVRWRVRWLGLPYGDQGIFVRRAVFHQMGGFAAMPLMEDVEFVGRLKRQGPLRHLTLEMTTSAQRWEREGWWRRSATNLVFLGLYKLGVSTAWLSRQYDRT